MDNEQVKKFFEERPQYSGSVSEEMWDFIKRNYHIGNSPNKFFIICKRGADPKYCRMAVDPITMTMRGLTFDEFYGGGVVD